ncbi:MAG: putative RNA-binding protein Jag [Candidatus Marinamargulisbacteria bacterium]|jgi:predicted RNA-binding protein Jag
MTERKGLFSFIRGFGRSAPATQEDKSQREHAMKQTGKETSDGGEKQPHTSEELNLDEGPVTEEIVQFSLEKLKSVLELARFEAVVKVASRAPRRIVLEVKSETDIGRIIGKEGSTIESIQILIKHFVIRKYAVPVSIILDADGYRKRRGNLVRTKARKAAQVVLSGGESVHMENMPASERKTIHMLFQEDSDIETASEGEGSSRHVVINKRTDSEFSD